MLRPSTSNGLESKPLRSVFHSGISLYPVFLTLHPSYPRPSVLPITQSGLPECAGLISTAVISTITEYCLGRKGFISSYTSHWGKSGQNSSGNRGRNHVGKLLISLPLAHVSYLPYTAQAHLPRDSSSFRGLGPLTSSSNWDLNKHCQKAIW